MDITKLKEILTAFSDNPASLLVERGRIVVQIQEELITASTSVKDGQLLISEDDGAQVTAERWVARRIAQMDFLADRIVNLFPVSDLFVTPKGFLLDQIEEVPDETPQHVDDALASATRFLSRKPGGMCSVLYLTSDAGE